MYKAILPRFNLGSRCNIAKRFFLSNAYRCEEAWANRLKNPCFEKINPGNLYHELDLRFLKKSKISTLDVDLLINSVSDDSYKNEVTDVLLQLRLCPECVLMPERTNHAAIRLFMDIAETDEFLNILSDRISYGLFPDYYLSNLLMDKYLKEKDAVSAVKIAALQMLQEDFDHPIMKVLAVHSCYNYLESPEIWPSYVEAEPDPDEEVQKVRVSFLRNPYFDDHFDITDTNHLVGKTLWLFGCTVAGPLGASSQLLGLVLYEKYQKCAEFLEGAIQNGLRIHEEAINKAKEFCMKKPKQPETPSEEKKEDKNEAKAETVDEWKNKVLNLLEKMDKKNLIPGSLLSASVEEAKKVVKEYENKNIEHQSEVYRQWEKEREQHILTEIQLAEREQVLSELQQVKADMEKEEERLFFFDREEDFLIKAEEIEKEMQSVVYYKGKGKHRDTSESKYIPPDVSRRKN